MKQRNKHMLRAALQLQRNVSVCRIEAVVFKMLSLIPHCLLIFASQAQNYGVKIYWNSKQYFASVLFRSRDGFAYDVAVLRAGPGATFRSVNFSNIPAVKGNTLPTMNVFCVQVIFARDET
jgi:hypothetical protein